MNPPSEISNLIAIKSINEFQRSDRNIIIVTADVDITSKLYLGNDDKLFVEINSQNDREKIEEKYKGFKISTISPYNNKGCFYPPALIQGTTLSQTFVQITK